MAYRKMIVVVKDDEIAVCVCVMKRLVKVI